MQKQIEEIKEKNKELEKRVSFLEDALKQQLGINEECIKVLTEYRKELDLLTTGLAIVDSIFENFAN